MVALILSTTISCSQAISILNRVQNVIGLTSQQKLEILMELKKMIPSCPVKIEKNQSIPIK